MKSARYTLCLASLNPAQIIAAKSALGQRRRITHVLLCGPYGKIFGTEAQCRKYFTPWSTLFPEIFEKAIESTSYELEDYNETRDLVLHLLKESDFRTERSCILKELLEEDLEKSPAKIQPSLLDRALKVFGINR